MNAIADLLHDVIKVAHFSGYAVERIETSSLGTGEDLLWKFDKGRISMSGGLLCTWIT
jgi:hypothetical protein